MPDVEALRAHLKEHLPGYMVPSAFVRLEELPLTPNGKVDRRALPEPDEGALQTREYEHPQGERENALARIWEDLLNVEKVGRKDNFFDLGGHSLLIVTLVERLRQHGLKTDIRRVFEAGSLWELAQGLEELEQDQAWKAPENVIGVDCERITPEMLPLVKLSQQEIDRIVSQVPGGVSNVQDIYPLAPLQEGILFHHRLHPDHDAYVTPILLSFDSIGRFERFIEALHVVVERHDVLRTIILWDGLPQAVQVVLKQASLSIDYMDLPSGRSALEQMKAYMNVAPLRMDMSKAPLVRIMLARDPEGSSCHALLLDHHIVSDHVSLEVILDEVTRIMRGKAVSLLPPPQYRTFVAKAISNSDRREAHAYFRHRLSDISETTAPFGAVNVRIDGKSIHEAKECLSGRLSERLRAVMRRIGLSPAVLFHVAWGLVVAKTSGREDVVFGSVMSGRMGQLEGIDRMLGMFINTLPIRMLLKNVEVEKAILGVHESMVEMLKYEQTPLSEAQRCSGVVGDTPLFTAILNYRHSKPMVGVELEGIKVVDALERTNYPLEASVDDLGEDFEISVQSDASVACPKRLVGYFVNAARQLIDALEDHPSEMVLNISILSREERRRVLRIFNDTCRSYPHDVMIQEVFARWARTTPDAIAVEHDGDRMSYAELDERSSQLANYLHARGVCPGDRVAILAERGLGSIVSALGVLKTGGVYLPVDPDYPPERVLFMIEDSGAQAVIVDSDDNMTKRNWNTTTINLELEMDEIKAFSKKTPELRGRKSTDTAYVMYTSGSTGKPKGVTVPHRAVNRLVIANGYADLGPNDIVAHCSNPAFDASTFEIWGALLNGARLVIVSHDDLMNPEVFGKILQQKRVDVLWLTVGLFNQYVEVLGEVFGSLKYLMVGGDILDPTSISQLQKTHPPRNLLNCYGPTETTTFATSYRIPADVNPQEAIPIGKPISNTRVYILDESGQPVPVGVNGELYIAGDGVANGYLNRPELSAERFVHDHFDSTERRKMYRTGDVGRWRDDGVIEYVGRNDSQVKIRGLRIELGEIESVLSELPQIREVVVIVREFSRGDKRLVGYWVQSETDEGRAAGVMDTKLLQDYVRAHLPSYMVPAAFVQLEALPLTPNGKVDRKSLPDPDVGSMTAHSYEPPVGETEELLVLIWKDLLGVDRVGRNDNFFELGGHSLLAIQLISRIKSELGVDVPVAMVFEIASLKELSDFILDAQLSRFHDSDVATLHEQLEALSDDEIYRLAGKGGEIF
ncbi:amino acid adenylation domain-containing protein [Lautropia mirabilis]